MEFILVSMHRIFMLLFAFALSVAGRAQTATTQAAAGTSMQFPFYGRMASATVPAGLAAIQFPQTAFEYINVARGVNEMAKQNCSTLVASLQQTATSFHLDNLGYLQLLKVASLRLFPAQTFPFRKAFVWFGLRQAGIDAILAGADDFINLFVRMENSPDGGFSVTHDGKRYISASPEKIQKSSIEVYRLQLMQDSARNPIQLDMYNTPLLGHDIRSRERSFRYGTKTFTLQTKYNADVVNYLNDLPVFRIGSYLYTLAPSAEADKSMDDSLTVWLQGKSYNEKLDFLLAMVQGAFPYKADGDYRSHEKRNFVEQTMADDYVDCEDKAALFCYLVNKYLSAETILLYSKTATHVCCAIELPEGAPGYTFQYYGKPYMVCEPAFQGMKPGQTSLTKEEIMHIEVFN